MSGECVRTRDDVRRGGREGATPRIRGGEWFAVPLRDRGFAVGVIARASKSGILFGYFFGLRLDRMPDLADTERLRPAQAVLVTRFSALGLRNGSWPILGSRDDWKRDAWPLPPLVRYEELTGRVFHVVYDDADPSRRLREVRVAPGVAEHGPRDALAGAGWVELRMTKLLR